MNSVAYCKFRPHIVAIFREVLLQDVLLKFKKASLKVATMGGRNMQPATLFKIQYTDIFVSPVTAYFFF